MTTVTATIDTIDAFLASGNVYAAEEFVINHVDGSGGYLPGSVIHRVARQPGVTSDYLRWAAKRRGMKLAAYMAAEGINVSTVSWENPNL